MYSLHRAVGTRIIWAAIQPVESPTQPIWLLHPTWPVTRPSTGARGSPIKGSRVAPILYRETLSTPQETGDNASTIRQYNIIGSARIPHPLRLFARATFAFCRPAARNMSTLSPNKKGRALVLAFDGTNNQFNDKVSPTSPAVMTKALNAFHDSPS